jgi:tRNA-dihydrouridine synthase A
MNTEVSAASRLSVAPMMAWTDRHCRFFHRLISKKALLYTEMVTAPALVLGGALQLLDFKPEEQPVALQLGGSDPDQLGKATALGAAHGYHEINLNLGCPSDRVQSGSFGAVLMTEPNVVRACLEQMQEACGAEITVKCRIGVDDQIPEDTLPKFLAMIEGTGVLRVTIHARKAWLRGLSPKENRDVPPLDYPLVHEMKCAFPGLNLSINGGVSSLTAAKKHLSAGMDGVMIGRAAYQNPYDILARVDCDVFDGDAASSAEDIAAQMIPYIEAHLKKGGRLHQITRHMFGLFAGQTGARHWRKRLSELGGCHSSDVADYRILLDEIRVILGQQQKLETI